MQRDEDHDDDNAVADEDLVKFPRTRHIFDAGGGVGRDDLLMTDDEADVWFGGATVSIEEKVDGSNLGISITPDYKVRYQNRSHYVTPESQAQWKQLDSWVAQHPGIFQVLTPDRILFGEWLYARHSIHYTRLPDLFLAFDIYDKREGKFYSRKTRDRLLEGTGIHTVPLVAHGTFTKDEMAEFLNTRSAYRDGFVEGIYVRIDEDDNEGLDRSLLAGGSGSKGRSRGGGNKRSKATPKSKQQAKNAAASRAQRQNQATTATTTTSNENGDPDALPRYLIDRAKVVRHDFITDPDIVHWSRQMLVKNIVQYK